MPSQSHGFAVHHIDLRTFNHGQTRQSEEGRLSRDSAFVIFLTHDAGPEGAESLLALLDSFSNSRVGAAYNGQIPHPAPGPLESHFVGLSYSSASETRLLVDFAIFFNKVAHISNSFATYRTVAF